ncbi:MAG: nuclear transport factor 2 family protein [Gemmatimonadota bacterium]|nr:nuclear transport factor 2 family protein [Gemmatimonadota bacterium]MDZ4863833.1 nuclear transport factor 2 family protein [Gemmatimonadota bacterium]
MRAALPLLTTFILLLPVAPAAAQSAADSAAIRVTALNYVEGWYEGNAQRMTRALHPELVKRIVHTDSAGHSRLEQMDAARLIKGAEAGYGKQTPKAQQQKDVVILDIYGNVASVRATMAGWIDCKQMARWNGEWRIVNVLWELKPRSP